MTDKPRLRALDGIRGALCLIVLAHHLSPAIIPGGVGFALSQCAVLGFFALSGCVLTGTYDGRYLVFLVRRALRLLPVLVLCWAVGCLQVGQLAWPTDVDPPVWSLTIESIAMVAFPLIVWGGSGSLGRLLLFSAACMVLGLVNWRLTLGTFFGAGAYVSRRGVPALTIFTAPWLLWIGDISYSLYLTQWLVLRAGIQRFGPEGALYAIPALFFVAWAVWRTLELPSIAASRSAGRLRRRRLIPIVVMNDP
jgi:peptidoglycan/LPS O-acetylase OafA/YrhL